MVSMESLVEQISESAKIKDLSEQSATLSKLLDSLAADILKIPPGQMVNVEANSKIAFMNALTAKLGALNQQRVYRDLQTDGEISTLPAEGGMIAIPSGQVDIDLFKGDVQVQQMTKKFSLSRSLNSIGAEMFKSFLVVADQPTSVFIDNVYSWACQLGITHYQANMRHKLSFNSYMPQVFSLTLSTSRVPPQTPLTAALDFRRGSGTQATTDSFTVIPMLPANISYGRGSGDGLPITRSLLDSSLVSAGERGPVTGLVKRKTIVVENTGTVNSLDVNIQGNANEGENFADDDTTGASVTVAAGNFAVFNIGKMWGRMRVRLKSTVAGNSTNGRVSMVGAFGSGSP